MNSWGDYAKCTLCWVHIAYDDDDYDDDGGDGKWVIVQCWNDIIYLHTYLNDTTYILEWCQDVNVIQLHTYLNDVI